MNKVLGTLGLFIFLTIVALFSITSCVRTNQPSDSVDSVDSVVRYELRCRMTGPDAGGEYLVAWNSSRRYYMMADGTNWVITTYTDRSYTPRQGEACEAYETSHPIR